METLGRYTLCRRIGIGGMAEVFLSREAVEGGGERLVVVKRAHAFLAADFSAVRMFLDEAQLVAQLRHPNIVQIFDLGSIAGAFYIAMEYVPGFDLLTVIQEHERQGEVIAEPIAIRLIAQAARALDHAHQAVGQDGRPLEIIHRDVSPQNILLSTAGDVKLIDFGVAKASIAKHATQVGIVKGKYPYMSPEQIAGDELDCRTDIYALGLVLYELLTNTRAVVGTNEAQVIANASRGRIAPIESLRPNLSVGLRHILARCLDLRREGRYPTAGELASELDRHLAANRQKVTAADCARLLQWVGSEPEVTLEDLDEDSQAGPAPVPAGAVSGIEATAVRSSSPSARRTELSMPSGSSPAHVVAKAQEDRPAARTELAVEVATEKVAAVRRHSGTVKVANPVAPEPRATGTVKGINPLPSEPAPAASGALPAASNRAWIGLGIAAIVAVGASGAAVFYARRPPNNAPAAPAVLDPSLGGALTPDSPVVPPVVPPVAPPDAPVVPPTEGTATPQIQAPSDPEPPAAALARLSVASTPATDVYLDGKKRGRTPLDLAVPAGPHKLEWKSAEEVLSRTVKVHLAPGQKHTQDWTPQKGTLAVFVVPFGEIRVDGISLGNKSYAELEIWEGPHLVSVTNAELNRTEKKQVNVVPGGQVKLEVNLQ